MEAAPDNVTKTSKCTTPAHLFAKSRGRVEEMPGLGAREEQAVSPDLSPSA